MPQLDTSTYISQIFWLIVSFFSLWLMMSVFIIPKIEEIMEQRRQKIDGYIQKAEKINKQALQSLEKYEKALKKAKAEANQQIEQNKAELEETINAKKAEIEKTLGQKIADNEFMLAKERRETMLAVEEVSRKLAYEILQKLDIEPSITDCSAASLHEKE